MNEMAAHYNNMIVYQSVSFLNIMALIAVIIFLMAAKGLKTAITNKNIPLGIYSSFSLLYSVSSLAAGFSMRFSLISAVSLEVGLSGLISPSSLETFQNFINFQIFLCLLAAIFNVIGMFIQRRKK